MATITIKQLQEKFKRKLEQFESNKILATAVLAINEARSKRIFVDGKNSQDKPIGKYSTKPMLATKDQFVVKSKFKQSKVEETRKNKAGVIKRTGNAKKVVNAPLWIKFPRASKAVPVMEIEGGYKEFRQIQGRESGFVNWKYSNELQNDLNNGIIKKSDTLYTVELKKAIDVKKVQGLEKKYGDVLKHTPAEKKLFTDIVQKEVAKILK